MISSTRMSSSWFRRSKMEQNISPEKQVIIEGLDSIEKQYTAILRTLKRKMPINSRIAYGAITQDVTNSIRHLHRLKHWIIYEEDIEGEKGGVF